MRLLRARDWLFLIVALLAVPICIRLGVWQLERLQERRARNAVVKERMSALPVHLEDQTPNLETLEYHRVVLEGRFDPEHEILLQNRSYQEQSGFHLVTPMLPDGRTQAVLIDRGWIPADHVSAEERARYHVAGKVAVEGILRSSRPEPRWSFLADPIPEPGGSLILRWRVLNIERIEKQMPYRLLPFFIEQDAPLNVTQPQPVPDPDIDLSDGPHLSYAIQWFAFAAIGLFGGGAWLYRRLRRVEIDQEG
jgi:surfeit locus 1 family protein